MESPAIVHALQKGLEEFESELAMVYRLPPGTRGAFARCNAAFFRLAALVADAMAQHRCWLVEGKKPDGSLCYRLQHGDDIVIAVPGILRETIFGLLEGRIGEVRADDMVVWFGCGEIEPSDRPACEVTHS